MDRPESTGPSGSAELEERVRELENEVVRRGVKVHCANIALARAKIAFEEAAKRREELFVELSHDLRTPLTSVKGAAQNLLDGVAGELAPSQKEYVEIVREQAEHLIRVVSTLIDSVRASAMPVDLTGAPVDVAEIAVDVARGMQPIADERKLMLVVRAERAEVVGDASKLRQVIENLVGNAIKYTDAGGTVTIETGVDASDVRIVVRDTGIGMSDVDVARAFDRFYRAKLDRPGSGLGLAITRDVVRLHGGDIAVSSRLGEGSELVVLLPRRAG